MRSIKDTTISGKKVLIRVDFNVPMDELQNITDDTRIRAVLPTLKYALDHNAVLIIASHLGRPKGKVVPEFSLAPIVRPMLEYINPLVVPKRYPPIKPLASPGTGANSTCKI